MWPRRRLDAALIDAAVDAGADVRFETEVESAVTEADGRVTGCRPTAGGHVDADLVVLAAGPQGAVARQLGAVRDPDEPYGLAIRAYVESPRHADRHIEACLTVKDEHGTWVPGYGWMFPCGDGTVNIGVGALSTMKGFKPLNLNTLLDSYRALVRDSWGIGPNLDRPRAWRLPMSAVRRHGPGLGRDRRRRRPDQSDERRGHRLRARVGSAGRRPVPRRPGDAPASSTTVRSASASTASCAPADGSPS